ncbi:MAG: DUF4339 domain-containing protein [Myxococcales bacterium]|nr:DUF4339 domain-containing protein [Myxococcales bacterium]
MKFHCERCKTQYSISDDRVRGKILKIRCKNCSAVITVREAGAGAEKLAESAASAGAASLPSRSASSTGVKAQKAGQKASAGAFTESVTESNSAEPGGSGSSAPPLSLEAEWYLSIEGEQEGPFSLDEARSWVQAKGADDDLHCWSEGYDDWLPADKVSHFRSLRRAPSRPPSIPADTALAELPTVADAPSFDEDTPRPLFAATMAAVESRSPGSAGDSEVIPPKPVTGPFGSVSQAQSTNGVATPTIPMAASAMASGASATTTALARVSTGLTPAPQDDDANLGFEIGEASRVVDLPALLASRGNAAIRSAGPIHKSEGLPGMGGNPHVASLGRGSGQQVALGARAATAPIGHSTGPNRVVGGSTPIGRSVALAPAAGSDPGPPSSRKRGGLHIPLIATGLIIAGVAMAMIIMLTGGDEGNQVARGTVGGSGNLGYSFGDTRRLKARAQGEVPVVDPKAGAEPVKPRIRKNLGTGPKVTPKSNGTHPVLPVRDPDEVDLGSGGTTAATGPLAADDLEKVYRKNQIAIKMCYERELKKNPLLKLRKTWVDINVGLDGRVSGVTIPSLSGTPLGNCMRSRIARWRFRKTTETFSSRFSVVFGS